jgi:peptidoglycan/LPS O-acetylase OafA/YrhL
MNLREAAATSGRRNNFNLVRLLAALCVLVSHSFALSTGNPDNEPLARSLGISLGSLAVVVFFITSGYLVGGSLLSRGDPARFVAARVMRIYPALIVVIVLSALVLGPLLTELPVARYFARSDTYRYVLTNGVAIFGVDFYLPEVFQHNPYRGNVNGSLWTLRFELWMYVLLLAAWLATAARGFVAAFAVIVGCLVVAGTAFYWQSPALVPSATSASEKLAWLTPMFLLGVAAHLLRDRIELSWPFVALAFAALIAAALAGQPYFKAAYPLCFAYIVLFVVYGLPALKWVQHQDYSYGLYIYGFVVQQILADIVPGLGVLAMTGLAAVLALACATASWHFIEKPALSGIDRMAAGLHSALRLLGFKAARAN